MMSASSTRSADARAAAPLAHSATGVTRAATASAAQSRARGQVPAIVILLGSGRGVDRLLHWSGETLLVTGILMAAKGISDVRRARTKLPGWSWPLAWQAGHPWGPSKVIVGWV